MNSFNLRVWASWKNTEWQKSHFMFINFSASPLFFHLMRLSGFFELASVNIITNFVVNISFLHIKRSASHTCLIHFILKRLAV